MEVVKYAIEAGIIVYLVQRTDKLFDLYNTLENEIIKMRSHLASDLLEKRD